MTTCTKEFSIAQKNAAEKMQRLLEAHVDIVSTRALCFIDKLLVYAAITVQRSIFIRNSRNTYIGHQGRISHRATS